MKMFMCSSDLRTWICIENGWTEPTKKNEDGIDVVIPMKEWTAFHVQTTQDNYRALYTLVSAVADEHKKLIKGCKSGKEAWEILEKHFEGGSLQKESRLATLSSKFENLKLEKGELVRDLETKMNDICIESRDLGEPILDIKQIRKILRCLPKEFDAKVAAIQESHDLKNLALGDVIGKLETWENDMIEKKKDDRKEKNIAFKVCQTDEEDVQTDYDEHVIF